MYANYAIGEEVGLGWWDGERLSRVAEIAGKLRTDDLLRGIGEWPEVRTGDVVAEPFRFRPAVLRPSKILCLLRSYRAHAAELGNEPPPEPLFFAKLPSALLGHGEPIGIPGWLEGEVHHEGELAVLLGGGGKDLTPDTAAPLIAGFTVANDVTARTLQKADAGRGWPWLRGKSLDTFLPLGPGVLPAASAPDPHDLKVLVRVDGEVRQDGWTGRLLWSIPEILARISRYVTLAAGDVILTGTPEGVGPIRPGERVEVEIPGVGLLWNPVRTTA